MAAQILGAAFVADGKYASSFPMFGVERRGAPVAAFLRFDAVPIRIKSKVYSPDCLMVFDPLQLMQPATFEGIKSGTILVANGPDRIQHAGGPHVERVFSVRASQVALEELGMAAVNTCMLGAFVTATGWLQAESVVFAIKNVFSGPRAEKNINSFCRGLRETRSEA